MKGETGLMEAPCYVGCGFQSSKIKDPRLLLNLFACKRRDDAKSLFHQTLISLHNDDKPAAGFFFSY